MKVMTHSSLVSKEWTTGFGGVGQGEVKGVMMIIFNCNKQN